MFHPTMIMFLFETSVPKSEIDCVSGLCSNARVLPAPIGNIVWGLNSVKSWMDTVEDCLSALERSGGGGGGQAAAAKRKADQKRKWAVAPAAGGMTTLWTSPEGM